MTKKLTAKKETITPQVVTPLKDLIYAVLEADVEIAKLEEKLTPLKEVKKVIKAQIAEEFKRRGEFTTRVEGATATMSVRKTAVVLDEQKVIKELKEVGLDEYVVLALSEAFESVKKEIALGNSPLINGMEIKETDYISIRKNDKADARKITTGEFVKLNK